MKKALLTIFIVLTILATTLSSSSVIAQEINPAQVVVVNIQSASITWTPIPSNLRGITLTITGPDNFVLQKEYNGNARPVISSGKLQDGTYIYEIVLSPDISPASNINPELRGLKPKTFNTMKQSGAFTVVRGSFVTAATEQTSQDGKKKPASKPGVTPFDVVNADDLIVQGSGCFGFDCVNNESFGFDTIRLKENNTRIGFNDTSVGAFPSNDWTIVANDTASGGANFLGFEDVTGSKFPFKVLAGAPTDSLIVGANGKLGVGTGTPLLTIHTTASDTPGLRLEQTGVGGFTPQTWDVAGNEANFFVRDLTGGSKLPFRIRPGAPTSSLDINSSGFVGIGTASPTFNLEVVNGASNAVAAVTRTTGATVKLVSSTTAGSVGTHNDFPLNLFVNNINKLRILSTSAIFTDAVSAPAFNTTSDRYAKENFGTISQASILERLSTIPITTWNFIENDNKTKHMGPMAQDFYAAFGLGIDDKHISTVDADGVAFAAIQELNVRNEKLSSENTALRSKVDDLTARVSALESNTTSSGQSSQNILVILLVSMNLGLIALVIWAIKRGAFATVTIKNK